MEDLFRKFIYTGVGFVSMTAEKFQKAINKLIDDNKISSDEGKKIIDDFVKNTNERRHEFEAQLKSVSEKVIKGLNYPTRSEVDELKKRVAVLEKELKKSQPAKSTTNKKRTTSGSKSKTTTSKSSAKK